jgi:hypothetical protein
MMRLLVFQKRIAGNFALFCVLLYMCGALAGCLPNINMQDILSEESAKGSQQPAESPQSVLINPVRAVRAQGNVFDPPADLLVYNIMNSGALELVAWDDVTAATITPNGGPQVDAYGYQFTELGNHAVRVRTADDIEGVYSLWVMAEPPPEAPQSILINPVKTVCVEGSRFDPPSDLLIYRTKTSGALEPGEWSEVTAVAITPEGGTQEDAYNYQFTKPGNHEVKVWTADNMEGVYHLWVMALNSAPPPNSSNPQGILINPVKTIYAEGSRFDPPSGLAVYRTMTSGSLEQVPWNEVTAVEITPEGGTQADANNYQFTKPGNHQVKVKTPDTLEGVCNLWVAAPPPAGAQPPVGTPQGIMINPVKTIYAEGSRFNPQAGLAVYRTMTTGALEQVDWSDVTAVEITPEGGTQADAYNYQFTKPGNHQVKVKTVDNLEGVCNLWVAATPPVGTPQDIMVNPVKTIYAYGSVFDPPSGLAVYRTMTTGELEPVDWNDVTAVEITPEGGTQADAYNYQFAKPGNYEVKVKTVDNLEGVCGLWVMASAEVNWQGLTVIYDNGDPGVMTLNTQGEFVMASPRGRVIHTIIPEGIDLIKGPVTGGAILLGRKDTEAVKLSFDEQGNLQFRPAQGYGLVPVGSVAELNMIDSAPAGKYALEANLDLLGKAAYIPTGSTNNDWTPIGKAAPFTGIFDGGGCTLDNLYIDDNTLDNAGLFAQVGAGGVVRNLTVAGEVTGHNSIGGVAGSVDGGGSLQRCVTRVKVTGNSTVGGVAGSVSRGGNLQTCENRAEVTGRDSIGGVAGYLGAGYPVVRGTTMTGCYNSGDVSGSNQGTGGVVGYLGRDTTMTGCYNSGKVQGYQFVGGVAGEKKGMMTGCYNSGDVSGSDQDTGGVVGDAEFGPMTACYNTGNVSGGYRVGGVAGSCSVLMAGCYNTGDVSGGGDVGGVAGSSGTIIACYNTGDVSGNNNVGGVVGNNYDTITGCYNSGDVSGNNNVGGVAGANTNVPGRTATTTACYWDSNAAPLINNGIGNPPSNPPDKATPFNGSGNFPNVKKVAGWETGNGNAGKYWKPGTTGGGALPKLYFE